MTSQQGLDSTLTDDTTAETLDLSQYWRTLKRAKWLIAAVTLVCLLVGTYIAATATPVYQASIKILADPQQPNAAREEQYIASALVFLFYETQYEILQSRAIAQTVVDKLGLVEQYKKQQLALARELAEIEDNIEDMTTVKVDQVEIKSSKKSKKLKMGEL